MTDVTFTWDHPAEGEYQLFVVVDDDGTGQGQLTEINEINNTAVARGHHYVFNEPEG